MFKLWGRRPDKPLTTADLQALARYIERKYEHDIATLAEKVYAADAVRVAQQLEAFEVRLFAFENMVSSANMDIGNLRRELQPLREELLEHKRALRVLGVERDMTKLPPLVAAPPEPAR